MKEPTYTWYEDTGVTVCNVEYKNKIFTGKAICHENDEDMKNQLSGQIISSYRAAIELFRFIRDCELKPQLEALWQLYYAMERSTQFNPKSYETKMLYRHIRNLTEDLDTIKLQIATTKENLKAYINKKDEDYKTIRAYRAKREKGQN